MCKSTRGEDLHSAAIHFEMTGFVTLHYRADGCDDPPIHYCMSDACTFDAGFGLPYRIDGAEHLHIKQGNDRDVAAYVALGAKDERNGEDHILKAMTRMQYPEEFIAQFKHAVERPATRPAQDYITEFTVAACHG